LYTSKAWGIRRSIACAVFERAIVAGRAASVRAIKCGDEYDLIFEEYAAALPLA
jgi:hypothetical protein